MEQHRGAEADCVTLHGGHERTGGFAEITNESKRLALACVLAVGLGAEIGEVVSGREAVAVCLKEHHSHGRIFLRALQLIRHGTVHGVGQGVLLVNAGKRQCHDAVGYLGLDVFSHDRAPHP